MPCEFFDAEILIPLKEVCELLTKHVTNLKHRKNTRHDAPEEENDAQVSYC